MRPLLQINYKCIVSTKTRNVSCTGTRYRGSCTGSHYMIGWHEMTLGCRRRGPAACRPPHLQLSGNSKWRWRLSDQ